MLSALESDLMKNISSKKNRFFPTFKSGSIRAVQKVPFYMIGKFDFECKFFEERNIERKDCDIQKTLHRSSNNEKKSTRYFSQQALSCI